MTTEERSIINQFLARNDLRHVTGAEIRSLDDLAEAESRGSLLRKRFEAVRDILREYVGRTSVNVLCAYSDRAVRSMNLERFAKYQQLDDYSEADFELYLKYVRAICEGLCAVFPPENGGAA